MTRTKQSRRRSARPPVGATKEAAAASGERSQAGPAPPARSEEEAFAAADRRSPFGPSFFRTQLRAFLRDDTAETTDVLPVVEIHLGERAPLDLSHIISITPNWVALAVRTAGDGSAGTRLRTEFVPYESITRVTLLPVRPFASQLGFDLARMRQDLRPAPGQVMTPAAALRSAAGEEEAQIGEDAGVVEAPGEGRDERVTAGEEHGPAAGAAPGKSAPARGRGTTTRTRSPRPRSRPASRGRSGR